MLKKKQIWVLSTIDYGGAGIGAQLAAQDLRIQGYNVDFLVFAQKGDDKQTISFINIKNKICSFFFRAIWFLYRTVIKYTICQGIKKGNQFTINHTFFSAKRIIKKINNSPDLILLGWTDGFISTETVRDLYRLTHAKIAYIMIDNAPITGGCHYPFKCTGYQKDCSACPIIGYESLAKHLLIKKQQDLKDVELYLLGTTHDCSRAKLSSLFSKAQIFPYVQTNELPSSFNKQQERVKFNLNKNDFIIFFGAQDVENERKGFNLLIEALQLFINKIEDRNVTLLIAGNYNEFSAFNSSKVQIKQIGHVCLPDLYCAYAAADIFVCPSIEDSGPMMINYSIGLCTPVIAFKMGVALDLVIPGETGFLVDLYDTLGLAEYILKMYKFNSSELSRVEKKCLLLYQKMQKEYSLIHAINRIFQETTDV